MNEESMAKKVTGHFLTDEALRIATDDELKFVRQKMKKRAYKLVYMCEQYRTEEDKKFLEVFDRLTAESMRRRKERSSNESTSHK